MRLPAKRDRRFAGDAFDVDRAASEIMAAAMREQAPSGITLEGSWGGDSWSNFGDTSSNYIPGYREGFIGQGANGRVWTDEPGLVRKEINVRNTSRGRRGVQEEVDLQARAAELGFAPRVAAYETAMHGDLDMPAIVMQDLNAPGPSPQGTPLYKSMENIGEDVPDYGIIRQNMMDELADPERSTSEKRFALQHFKQMGQLALKGVDPMDRHTGNVFKHEMTGRPLQIDFGLARELPDWYNGPERATALLDATVQGFRATGQYDVAEIINDTAFDYLSGGQIKEAWDFTREAFAQLQKIKTPISS